MSKPLTADDIDAMDDEEFGRFIELIGIAAQARAALERLRRDPIEGEVRQHGSPATAGRHREGPRSCKRQRPHTISRL